MRLAYYILLRISNDERVLYNDTETLTARLLSHLLGSYVTHVLQIARISNNERVLYNFYLHKCMLDFNFRNVLPRISHAKEFIQDVLLIQTIR